MHGTTDVGMDMIRLTQYVADQVVLQPLFMPGGIALQLVEQRVRFVIEQLAVHQCRNMFFHVYHLWSLLVPSNGRKLVAIASRARKILDRTVPTGQFITVAISS